MKTHGRLALLTVLVCLVLNVCNGQQLSPPYRTWTLVATGKETTFVAAFENYSPQERKVYFTRADGTRFRISDDSVSSADMLFLSRCHAVILPPLYGDRAPAGFSKGSRNLWELAAKGHTSAQTHVGWMYRTGDEGLPKDETAALMWYRKAADQGSAVAQYNVGAMYENGEGVPRDSAEAARWYRKAADQGNADAKTSLEAINRATNRSQHFAQSPERPASDDVTPSVTSVAETHGSNYTNTPLAELTRVAEGGNADAQTELAKRYLDGRGGVPQNRPLAFSWIKKAAVLGNPEAAEAMAALYASEAREAREFGIQPNKALAQQWEQAAVAAYRTRAEAGDAESQLHLSRKYKMGEGVIADRTESIRWLKEAVSRGSAEAFMDVGRAYAYGDKELGIGEDFDKGVVWFTKAAERGLVKAYISLAGMYKHRNLFAAHTDDEQWRNAPDFQKAFDYYQQAARRGAPEGQIAIGDMLKKGWGCQKDPKEAIEWFRKAAEQGYESAFQKLGDMYAEGEGTPQNYKLAVMWYLKGATNEWDSWSQYKVGFMYANGYGVPKDLVEAYRWLNLSASKTYPVSDEARELRDIVAGQMTTAQIAEGQRRSCAVSGTNGVFAGTFGLPSVAETEQEPRFSGTGFLISSDGYLLTASHVVANAAAIKVKTVNGLLRAKIVKTDSANDVTLLKVDGVFNPLPLGPSGRMKLGDGVFTIGFPNIELQGFSPKLTKGEISSLAGIQDDPRHFQVSVPVQPGNSGGALVDEAGNVVGLLVLRLSDATVEVTGMLPQNVNYALKTSYVLPLLEGSSDMPKDLPAPRTAKSRPFGDVAKEVESATVLVLGY